MPQASPMSITRTILVAYELAHPDTTRPQIAETLMGLGEAWARPLDTVWMLRTRLPASDVEARLAPLLGPDDGLMVQEARGEGAFANTGLRWFRPRRHLALAAMESAARQAFPQHSADTPDALDEAA